MAIIFVNVFLRGKEEKIESRYGMVEVVTAAREIPPNMKITGNFLTIREVPEKFRQPSAIIVKEPDQAFKRVMGKVSLAPIPAGAQVMESTLTEPNINQTGVAPITPKGKRGYPLRLGNTDVAKLILPGNSVDVIATFTVRGPNDTTVKNSYTILQNVLVLAVGTDLRESGRDVSSKSEQAEGLMLTLALDPDEAQKLALAQSESQGDISVTVRAQGDNEIRPMQPTRSPV